ncbi:MAG: AAA family ATPase, partial [archaeon]|nr:AAA family ATPase [archaeon]
MDTNRFTIKAQEAVVQARNLAIEQNHKEIYIEHFIMVLLNNENTAAKLILEKIGILTYKILEEIEYNLQFFPKTSGFLEDPKFSTDLRTLIEESIQEMNELNDNYLSGEHFLLALTNTLNLPVTSIFKKNGITKLRLIEAIREIRGQCADIHQNPEEQYEILKKYTRNLIDLARSEKLDPVICRDYEIDRLITILSRRTKNNPVLIGDAGVGKTAIVEGLAQRIYSRDVPQNLLDIQILSLDLGATVAGTRYRGEFEERITAILREITGNNEKYILFIDELHALVGAGAAEGSLDASTMLKPLLARGALRCIGATSVNDYRRYFEKDAGITRRFQPILVKEPNIEESIKILRILKKKYEKHHGIKINDNAIISAVKLSKRYISDRFLPDKAIDLIDEAASRYSANLDSMPLELNTLSRK